MVDEIGEGNEEKFGAKWTDTTFIKFSSQLVIFNADIGVGKKVSTSLTRHKTQADAARNGTGWDRASFPDRHTHKTCVMYAMFDQTHIHVNFCYIKYLILVVVVSVAAVCRFNLVASSCYQTSLIFYGGIKHKYHDFYSFREIVIRLRINSVSKILHLILTAAHSG